MADILLTPQSGKDIMSFVYDVPSLELALSLTMCSKLNSSDLVNGPMLKLCAESNLPLFLGTGASKIEEISEALSFLKIMVAIRLFLCTVFSFPTSLSDSRLS